MASATPAFLLHLSQVLVDLASPSDVRIAAEDNLNSILASSPSNTLLGLIQLAASATSESTRILAFVLLRRLTFKAVASKDHANPLAKEVWDLLKLQDQSVIQGALLECLVRGDKMKESERRALCDLIAEVETGGSSRGVTWPQLSLTLSQLFSSPALVLREAVFRIYSECVSLLEAQPIPSVIVGLSAGLKDSSPGVRLSALTASVALITSAESSKVDQYSALAPIMLEVSFLFLFPLGSPVQKLNNLSISKSGFGTFCER